MSLHYRVQICILRMKFKHYFDHQLFVTLIQGGLDKSSLLCLLDYFDHQVDVVNELKKYGDTTLNRHERIDTAGSKSVFYSWNWSVLLIICCLSQNSYPNIMDFLKFTLPFGLLWSLFVCHKIPTNQIWNLFFKVSFIFFIYVPHSNVLIAKTPIVSS